MKMIRMLKVMAGPEGVSPIGKTMTVSDETAAQLVEAEAAEVIATIAETPVVEPDPVEAPVVELDPVETPVVEPESQPKKKKATAA